ncbi:MAG: DUF475 domain-containing protein [Cyanobacteriota bacterium]|nr:DUF475 domain-containing protein [Cyanobacteriota bacterium]
MLPTLLLLETLLSADNALAMAAMVKPIPSEPQRRRLLNWGLAMAILLRLVAVAMAGSVIHNPLIRLLGGGYLVWLAVNHFRAELLPVASVERNGASDEASVAAPGRSELATILLLAGTNLAFSLDSITAALAITDDLFLVMVAGTIGVVALRGVASWLVSWMARCPNLTNAAYLTVLAVGLRLLVEQLAPPLTPADPLMLALMGVLLAWGLRQPQSLRC